MRVSIDGRQQDVVRRPAEGKVFLQGPAGSGKTTAGVQRILHLLDSGVPAEAILVLVPQRTLAIPYYEALHSPDLAPGGQVTVLTVGGLARRMVDLFWPLVAEKAGFGHSDRKPTFLTWVDQPAGLQPRGGRVRTRSLNVYRYDSPVGPIDIEVTTIHAVKGQNHHATLVLETFWWGQHDMAEMVEFLVGERSTDNLRPGNARERMKRVFVAMTRPRELLCLAMHGDHVSAGQKAALEDLGWRIEYLGA